MTQLEPIAVGLDEAGRMVGMSRSSIERAVRAGDLVAHYPTSRPVILVDDLRAWVAAAATERP